MKVEEPGIATEKCDNFPLKETITSVVDVITESQLTSETELLMKIGIIPNDVNGNYHNFKIMVFSLLEGLIVPA